MNDEWIKNASIAEILSLTTYALPILDPWDDTRLALIRFITQWKSTIWALKEAFEAEARVVPELQVKYAEREAEFAKKRRTYEAVKEYSKSSIVQSIQDTIHRLEKQTAPEWKLNEWNFRKREAESHTAQMRKRLETLEIILNEYYTTGKLPTHKRQRKEYQ